MTISTQALAIWAVAGLAIAGVILRPWRLPEAVWAVAGAAALIVFGLLPMSAGVEAVAKGADVYLFLTGMMLLSELAREEGLFEFLAALAVGLAKGSASRLFLLLYALGTVVTIFMSNDATAVVLTPAVYAVAKKAGAKPLPYLFACAMVANAASFVLPISNPANLVLFGSHLPPMTDWLHRFLVPSIVSIAATFAVLRLYFHKPLSSRIETVSMPAPISRTGKMAAGGIACVAVVLMIVSGLNMPLGLPTLITSALALAAVLLVKKHSPWSTLGHVSWSVLLLVAGLFVLVTGVEATGLVAQLAGTLREVTTSGSQQVAAGAAGVLVAIACNLVNNLPAGLLAGDVLVSAAATPLVQSAVLIGVDLGPNLSVTGSLATILWLIAIRREGETVGAWQFLKLGAIAMPAALIPALAALLV
ncbi:MAG: arsenic transporter [Burkholderiaceae bacterium]